MLIIDGYQTHKFFHLPVLNMVCGTVLQPYDKKPIKLETVIPRSSYYHWFAHCGKPIRLKKQSGPGYGYQIKNWEETKIKNGYTEIDEATMPEMWPDLDQKLKEAIIFERLQNG